MTDRFWDQWYLWYLRLLRLLDRGIPGGVRENMSVYMSVYECVCERERERQRETETEL